MSLEAPFVAPSRPARRVGLGLLGALLLAALLYGFAGYAKLDEVLPGATEFYVEVRQPAPLIGRLAATPAVRELANTPDLEALREFLAGWSASADNGRPGALMRAFFQGMTLAEWIDEAAPGGPERRAALFVDAGILGRLAKDAARLGFYDLRKSSGAIFLGDFIVVGPDEGLAQARAAYAAGKTLARGPEAERLRRAREAADPKADAVVYLVKESLLRPAVYGASFDPRAFLNSAAIRYAFLEVTLQADRLAGRLVLEPMAGKRVGAVAAAPPGPFVTRALAAGDIAAYFAWRPDRAAELSPILLGRFAGDEMKDYQKKLAMLMLNTFFDCAGQEFAIVAPRGGPPNSPTLVFRLAKKTEMIDLLSKLSKSAQAEAAALGAAIGPNGASLDDVLASLQSDEGLQQLLAAASEEQRAKLTAAARRVRSGELDPRALLRDAARVYMFGRYWHWRTAGDLLVLSSAPEQAEAAVDRLAQSQAPEARVLNAVPADGVALATIDLGTLLRDWLSGLPAAADWLDAHPATLALAAKDEGGRLIVSAALVSGRP